MIMHTFKLIKISIALFSFCALANSSTMLDYPIVNDSGTKLNVPQSNFHDWQQAEEEALHIFDQWKAGPVTVPWTQLQLQRFIKHKMMPTRGARGLALNHVAMHDAFILANKQSIESSIAISMASARVLGYLFPAEEKAFERTVFTLASLKYSVSREQLPDSAVKSMLLGIQVAQKVIEYGEHDGAQRGWNGKRLQWYGEGRHYGPGSWEPTPPYFYYPPAEPYAPTWIPWVLSSADQFRADPPPIYGSNEFIAALKEVIEITKNITPEQLKLAKYWVDGYGSVTPAGHWNQIAIDYVISEGFSDEQTIQLFLDLNIAMADAFISAWDSKYFYWSIRPVTAAKKILGINFKPSILTPPFPSYVSGHAATSGAASAILASYFPVYDKKFTKMGDQAAMSRLYGGIHYRFDNDKGLEQGRQIAEIVFVKEHIKNQLGN